MKRLKLLLTVVVLCLAFISVCTPAFAEVSDNLPHFTFDTIEEWEEWYLNNRTCHFTWESFRYTDGWIDGKYYPYYPFNDYETKEAWKKYCYQKVRNGELKFEFVLDYTIGYWGMNYYDNAPAHEMERIHREREKAGLEPLNQILEKYKPFDYSQVETSNTPALSPEQRGAAFFLLVVAGALTAGTAAKVGGYSPGSRGQNCFPKMSSTGGKNENKKKKQIKDVIVRNGKVVVVNINNDKDNKED